MIFYSEGKCDRSYHVFTFRCTLGEILSAGILHKNGTRIVYLDVVMLDQLKKLRASGCDGASVTVFYFIWPATSSSNVSLHCNSVSVFVMFERIPVSVPDSNGHACVILILVDDRIQPFTAISKGSFRTQTNRQGHQHRTLPTCMTLWVIFSSGMWKHMTYFRWDQ